MRSRLSSLVLLLGVLGLTAWSLWPGATPPLPGVLRLGLYDGPGSLATEHAVAPYSEYLGLAIRRGVRAVVYSEGAEDARLRECDLLLLPNSRRGEFPDYVLLAHTKGHGRVGQLPRAVLVRAERSPTRHDLIVGDRFSWRDDPELLAKLGRRGYQASWEDWDAGHDPYDHREALAALAHGAYAAALVRDGDLADALADGLIRADRIETEILGERAPAFVLLARESLGERTRNRVRSATLELDHLRLDEASLRVQLVLAALAQLGLDGFVPAEPFPDLRP